MWSGSAASDKSQKGAACVEYFDPTKASPKDVTHSTQRQKKGEDG